MPRPPYTGHIDQWDHASALSVGLYIPHNLYRLTRYLRYWTGKSGFPIHLLNLSRGSVLVKWLFSRPHASGQTRSAARLHYRPVASGFASVALGIATRIWTVCFIRGA
jgi:hypothetical protein